MILEASCIEIRLRAFAFCLSFALSPLMQNSVMPCSFFGVSPPIRNGWAGGAANPLAHDKTWDKSAYNASHVNLQVGIDLITITC